jgi:hypothetical protein
MTYILTFHQSFHFICGSHKLYLYILLKFGSIHNVTTYAALALTTMVTNRIAISVIAKWVDLNISHTLVANIRSKWTRFLLMSLF